MSSQAAAEVVGSFLSQPVRDKTVSAAEAIRLIRDRDTVVVGGFLGACFPEELTLALEERFRGAGGPRELTVVFPVAAGDLKGRGLDRLAHAGLLRRAIGGRWAAAPGLQKLAVEGAIEAYNLPLGCMSQLFQDIAGRKPGSLSRVGLIGAAWANGIGRRESGPRRRSWGPRTQHRKQPEADQGDEVFWSSSVICARAR